MSSGSRRFYQSYNQFNPPRSRWQRSAPYIITGGAVGLCIIGYGYHLFSINQYITAHDRRHVDLVEQNFVNSRENLLNGRWWTLVSSSFMHYGFLHLACNMYGLISFGPYAVQTFGPGAFIGLWLGSAVACGAAAILWEQFQKQERRKRGNDRIKIFGRQLVNDDPTATFARSIGASGSLLGIVTAQCCLYPRLGISMIGLPFSIPAWGAGLIFVNFSLWAMVTGILPGIGHAGHLGGMAFGAAYYYSWLRRRLRLPRF